MATLTGSQSRIPRVNRRTLLGAAGGLSAFGLVSYFIYEFSLSIPVLITATNETGTPQGLLVKAQDMETNQQRLDEAVTVPSDGSTQIGRVPNADAQISVELVELAGDSVDEESVIDSASTFVGEDTKRLTIAIADDSLELELEYRESADGADQTA